MSTYLVVANADCARIFRRNARGRMHEFERFVHPMSRSSMAEGAMPARQRNDGSQNAYLATLLAAYLRHARRSREASSFIVSAPPQLLILLPWLLDRQTARMVVDAVPEDLADGSQDEILSRFQSRLSTPSRAPRRQRTYGRPGCGLLA